MRDTYKIHQDLEKALSEIDNHNYVLKSIMAHVNENCTDAEIKIIESEVYELPETEYTDKEDFTDDYQPIFDLVDFPISDCFLMMKQKYRDIEF